jgi:hypothetical protein
MKRLMCALAVPIVLMSTVNLAHAGSVFRGTLNREHPWELMVDNSGAVGPTALAILYLTTATKSETVLLSVSGGGRQAFRDLRIPRGTRRIVLEVSPPQYATIDVEITQSTTEGNVSYPHRVELGATVVFGVVPLLNPPVAVDDTAVTDRNVATSIGVLFNDSSADGAALFVNSTTDPPHGSATIYADGSVIYTPDAGFVGFDSFDYEACADVLCAQATVHVEVR